MQNKLIQEALLLWLCGLCPPVLSGDAPCHIRVLPSGTVCVCDSSFCDTVATPPVLPRGHYHHYYTAERSPGFSHVQGTFANDASNLREGGIVVTINNLVRFQEVLGFGGSFTDSFGIVFNSLPADAQEKLVESYFGPNGIQYTLGRVPIGGTDFSTRHYTLDDIPYDEDLQHFSLTYEDHNLKIPLIKRAMSASSRNISLYGCAWNYPDWMGTNNTASYLSAKYLKTWADYHVKFLQAYAQHGVNMWGISGGNQPAFRFLYGPAPGPGALAQAQRWWVKHHLGPRLRAKGLGHVKVLALDDQRPFANYWMSRFSADPSALALVDGVALHWYMDFFTPATTLDDLHKQFPDKLILYTEMSINTDVVSRDEPPVVLGSWKRAELYIFNIIENISHWTNGYIDWNLALDTSGGPTTDQPIDAAVIVNTTGGEFYKQPIFYGLGHFSKFIPPGSRRVQVLAGPQETPPEPRREFTGFGEVMFPLPYIPPVVQCLATANSDGSHTVVVFNPKNVTASIAVVVPEIGVMSLDVQEHSINSFVYWL